MGEWVETGGAGGAGGTVGGTVGGRWWHESNSGCPQDVHFVAIQKKENPRGIAAAWAGGRLVVVGGGWWEGLVGLVGLVVGWVAGGCVNEVKLVVCRPSCFTQRFPHKHNTICTLVTGTAWWGLGARFCGIECVRGLGASAASRPLSVWSRPGLHNVFHTTTTPFCIFISGCGGGGVGWRGGVGWGGGWGWWVGGVGRWGTLEGATLRAIGARHFFVLTPSADRPRVHGWGDRHPLAPPRGYMGRHAVSAVSAL